jgi:hypothetical protein
MNFPDISLDSVAELAGFELPPVGRYLATLSLEAKDINGKGNLVFKYKTQELVEAANPSDADNYKSGAKFDELFSFEKGLPMARTKLVKLCEAVGIPTTSKLAEIVEAIQDVGVEVTLKHRVNGDKTYPSVPQDTFKVA